MSKDKLIPELRFPEFKNEGEWEEKIQHLNHGFYGFNDFTDYKSAYFKNPCHLSNPIKIRDSDKRGSL